MMHPDTEIRFISEVVGYGVVATKPIPKGTITWVQDELDQVFTPAQVEGMHPVAQQMIDKYAFRNNKGCFVLCWDLSKYVNHSFRSNCLSTAYGFEMAIRDIAKGEELTDDYGYLNVTEAFRPLDENSERKAVFPDDLLHFYEKWDCEIEKAFPYIRKVPQALEQLISANVREQVKLVLNNKKSLDSILNLYYRADSVK